MDNRRKLYIAISLFLVICLLGVAGFKIIGGPQVSLLDSAYMTAITVSTIGYGKVVDLSGNPSGRVFTILFIFLSVGTIAFAISSITGFIVEGELKNLLGRRRIEKDSPSSRITISSAAATRPPKRSSESSSPRSATSW